jgi:phosphoribosylformylglycinamidine synthase
MIGMFGGENIKLNKASKPIIDLRVDKAQKTWFNSLRELVVHG